LYIHQSNFIDDRLTILPVETNILIFELKGRFTAKSFEMELAKSGIYTIAISPTQIRMVTHLDVTEQMITQLISFIESL
jgi:threonine aldolase